MIEMRQLDALYASVIRAINHLQAATAKTHWQQRRQAQKQKELVLAPVQQTQTWRRGRTWWNENG